MSAFSRFRRRVDRRYYRALYRLARLLFPTDVDGGPVAPGGLRRILVLPNYKVGDLVVATPALAYLREVAPQARIDVLVSARNASLLDGDARVDRVLLHDPHRDSWLRLARRLRRERYDLVVDFVLPHHLREGLVTAAIAGRRAARVSPYRPAGFWGFFTHRPRVPGFERRHMAERLLYSVQAALGGGAGDGRGLERFPIALTVSPPAAARVGAFLDACVSRPFVAFNAWASDRVRTLGVAQSTDLVVAVLSRHGELAVVLTPPPGAGTAADAIAAAVRARVGPLEAGRVVVFPPSPQLADLVALLQRAAVVFTPDTANVHLAAATGRPVVALYTTLATERVAHWIPYGVPHRTVIFDAKRPLADLGLAPAIAAFDALWAEIGGATPTPHACRHSAT